MDYLLDSYIFRLFPFEIHPDTKQNIVSAALKVVAVADWWCKTQDPQLMANNHATLMISEFTYALLWLLSLTFAFQHGARFAYTWVGIQFLAFFTESMMFLDDSLNVVWHSQTMITFMGMRTPLYILFGVYHTLFYTSYVLVKRISLQWWGEAALNGIFVLVLSLPFQIMGTKLLWWQWHDTDPRLANTFYSVPVAIWMWYTMLAASFNASLYLLRNMFLNERYNWKRFTAELFCVIGAAFLALFIAAMQYLFFFTILQNIFKIYSGLSSIFLIICYAATTVLAFYKAKVENNFYHTEIKAVSKVSPSSKQLHISSRCLSIIVVHLLLHMLLVVFSSPENVISEGIHQAIGPCKEVEHIFSFSNQMLYRQKYMCLEKYQQKLFDFHCIPGGQISRSIDEPLEYYAICGTSFENRSLYIVFIWTYCIAVIFVMFVIVYITAKMGTRSNGYLYSRIMENYDHKFGFTSSQDCSSLERKYDDRTKYLARSDCTARYRSSVPDLGGRSSQNMVQNITRAELCARRGVILFEKYRARIVHSSDLPVIKDMSWMMGKEIVVIGHFLESEDNNLTISRGDVSVISEKKHRQNPGDRLGFGELGNHTSANSQDRDDGEESEDAANDSEHSASPLKYEFLTLSKLQAENDPKFVFNEQNIWFDMKHIVRSCMSASEARSLAGRFAIDGIPFDVPDPIIWIPCDATDPLHTFLLGFCKTNEGKATYHVGLFQQNHMGLFKFLENHMQRFYGLHKVYADTAYCVYDVLPKIMTTEVNQRGISAFVDLYVSWKFPCADQCSVRILSRPISTASVIAKISPGWLDVRMSYFDIAAEMEQLFALGRALRTGRMTWINSDPSKMHEDSELVKNIGLGKPHDFTEEIWLILLHCPSNRCLIEALECVFNAFKSGYKSTILPSNRSTMARVLRDANCNELLLPRLEGLTPIQICLEMGLERLRRTCVNEFLDDERYLGSMAEIHEVFDFRIGQEPQYQADALFLQILGQYSKLSLSPTTEDICENMIGEMTFTLNSALLFGDVVEAAYKKYVFMLNSYTASCSPKMWKSEVVIETPNKQGWVARSMILCSRTAWPINLMNSDLKESALSEKSSKEEENIGRSNCSKVSLEEDMSSIAFQDPASEDKGSNLSGVEKMESNISLNRYEIAVVTGKMMRNSGLDRCSEYAAQFFGFVPKGFTDVVYNIILEKWADIVEKTIVPIVPLDDSDDDNIRMRLKVELTRLIAKNNILNSLVNKLEAYVLGYVFRIPDEVTLPEDRPNLVIDKKWSLKAANKRIRKLKTDIIHVYILTKIFKMASEFLDKEIMYNQKAVQMWEAMQQVDSIESNGAENDKSDEEHD
ncbi:unnamed protein product [Thelazia callipaeda]|uniref:Protein zwilch n=1 Tax=Thelazia callipaeda TaxID=103827 RepID=A0A0N5D8C5_THECL|nr:unnamed protein product [Thelazia callipaeda]